MPFLCFTEGFLVDVCFLGLGLEEFYQFLQSFLNPFYCLFFSLTFGTGLNLPICVCLSIFIALHLFTDVHGTILDPYHK